MRILIVGSLNNFATAAAKIAFQKGARVNQVPSITECLQLLRSGKGADVIMIDCTLSIRNLVQSLEQERFYVPIVACGIDPDPDMAADAIRAGAKEYVPLPPDPEMIAAVINAVASEDRAFIFNDPRMKQVQILADRIAPSEASILITGESGTGKEVMARYIHEKSKRKDKTFVSINCAAIPENLLESELFGHEKGAFTGAVARRIGKFEEATGGTLLLDEVTEMNPRLQAKLLRAIQERVIDRVGGNQPVRVDIRIIATSNRDMLEAVREGQFREDLYFRLNVVNVNLPPLRERPGDVTILAEHFARKYCDINALPLKKFSESAEILMRQYDWRGNVRELENVIHRAVLLSDAMIQAPDLMIEMPDNPQTVSLPSGQSNMIGRTVHEVERTLILDTLSHCLGNRTHAANILGISIRTLRNKLKEYSDLGLSIPASGSSS